jgi:hypothetical protein
MPGNIPANQTPNSITFGCLIVYQPLVSALLRRSRGTLQIPEQRYVCPDAADPDRLRPEIRYTANALLKSLRETRLQV